MKFKNINEVPLFGTYTDPYKERRVKGNTRPSTILPYFPFTFQREYKEEDVYVSWLGHSSIFLHISTLNILIDPIFSKYASPIQLAGPKRFKGKVPTKTDFPEIDLVCITHNHYDHLDRNTLRSLDSKVKTYIVPKGVKGNLLLFGISKSKIIELDWNEEYTINDLIITSLPSQHDSSRYMVDMDRTLWCSYLFRNKIYTIFNSGDGGFTSYFDTIYQRYGSIDLAIMECGQYNEKWHAIHMFPEECVEACQMLHAKVSIPVHYGAYVLSDHAYNEPPIRFEQRAKELHVNYYIPKLFEMVKLEKKTTIPLK